MQNLSDWEFQCCTDNGTCKNICGESRASPRNERSPKSNDRKQTDVQRTKVSTGSDPKQPLYACQQPCGGMRAQSSARKILSYLRFRKPYEDTYESDYSDLETDSECELYCRLMVEKLKPLSKEDRMRLMNAIDNLIFSYMVQHKRDNISANARVGSNSRLPQLLPPPPQPLALPPPERRLKNVKIGTPDDAVVCTDSNC